MEQRRNVPCGSYDILNWNERYIGYISEECLNNGIEFMFVDFSDVSNFKKAIKKNTKLLWIETPTNPLLKLADIAALSKIAKEKGIMVCVDNMFMSPYF
jgi:cystathionine beta-lyase/cystathionine gamma-synthase